MKELIGLSVGATATTAGWVAVAVAATPLLQAIAFLVTITAGTFTTIYTIARLWDWLVKKFS